MHHGDTTLGEMLERAAAQRPDAPFLQDRDRASLTFAEVHLGARTWAGGLAATGVRPGDPVLLMLPNGLDLVLAWFGCAARGAIEVPINTFARGDFLAHLASDSSAAVVVTDREHLPHLLRSGLPGAVTDVVVVDATSDDVPAAPSDLRVHSRESLTCATPQPSLEVSSPSDVTAVYYTSGTTGPAKGVMFTHAQGQATARRCIDATGAGSDDVFFCCMPLFHSNAQTLQVLVPLALGARVSVWPEFSASQWLDQVRSVGATVTNTLGVMAEFVHRQPERDDDADNPLRVVQTIPAPPGIVADWERRFGVTCIDGYGLTDVGMVAFRRHDEPLVPGSSGTPVADVEVVIADPDTDDHLPAGSTGQILLRPRDPAAFMRGYWRRPEATVEAWRGLWFRTGDAGMLDTEGRLHFRGRIGDSIRVRGENVSAAEIEAVVSDHPDIVQCAAVAVPSDVGDDDVLLVLVATPGVTVDPVTLVRHCEGRMPYFAVPRYWQQVQELPVTPTQKVRKVELRARGVAPDAFDRRSAGLEVSR